MYNKRYEPLDSGKQLELFLPQQRVETDSLDESETYFESESILTTASYEVLTMLAEKQNKY